MPIQIQLYFQFYKYIFVPYNLLTYSVLFKYSMQDQHKNPYIDYNYWCDYIEVQNKDPKLSTEPFFKKCELTQGNLKSKTNERENCNQSEMMELLAFHQCINKELFKRSHSDLLIDEEFFTSPSQSIQQIKSDQNENEMEGNPKSGYIKQKYTKQYIYSKNYRQKKKQQFKNLQQENEFLKKKIEELQFRLQEAELEINRLKHHSQQKQLTIQELNKQFLTKVNMFAEKIQKDLQFPDGTTVKLQKNDKYYDQLMRTYNEHGFLGSRKKQLLNYYFNEILEVLLRDSQRYLCMLCCKNKDSRLEKQMEEYTKINHAFFEIIDINQEKKVRLYNYIDCLYPLMKEIKKNCSQFYKAYRKIIQTMGKVHEFMRGSYASNIDFVKKRMEFESWFEYHKYNKMMRKLKSQWLSFIKNQKQQITQVKKKRRKTSRVKRVHTNQYK